MRRRRQVVIVGAGAAGSAAAVAVAQAAPDVEVVVVGSEDRAPYNRTTVNKGLLSGAVDDAAIMLPGMDELGIDWRTGSVARSLDASTRTVELIGGTPLHSDAVLLATGASPRSLPSPIEPRAQDRVLALRTAADTARLRALLAERPGPVVIAGAGLIGTETAAVLLEAGCPVTVVDPARQPLIRHVGRSVASWIADAHRAAGVDLRVGTAVTAVRRSRADLQVDLDDGDVVPARAVLACLGVEPATGWLHGSTLPRQAGDARAAGVLVDHAQRVRKRTGLYAAGDLAAFPGPDGIPVRVEHWGAALEQGRVAAMTLLADLGILDAEDPTAAPVPRLPSYSTYVHGTKLTILGWPAAAIAERAVLGGPGDPRFAVALLDAADRVVGAVGVGGARAVNQMRPLVARRADAVELTPLQPVTPPDR